MDWLEEYLDEHGGETLAKPDCEWCNGSGWDTWEDNNPDWPAREAPCGCICNRIAYVEYFERDEGTQEDYDRDPYEFGTQEYFDWIPF